ncbi:hypothetical protein DFH07DRAFT_954348 [Mycena maculata]|uniref:Replication factor-A protein 1 N-terminal domain-containing protein n=1 Tax=Mycena maculata TaxID=230809 RepID=A0AAD7JPA6_9AGAR|nr:hypothetical protein DFH07DRAFT_954348 [Mycena maculata]
MDLTPLSTGSVEALCDVSKSKPESQLFVLQLLSIKALTGPPPPELPGPLPRYRVILSDGDQYFGALLGSKIAQRFTPNWTQRFVIVGVEQVQWVYVSQCEKWVLVIVEMHFIEDGTGPIGRPTLAMGSPAAFRPKWT